MNKIRVAVVGKGNIGKYAAEAVNAAQDMELCGIVARSGVSEEEQRFFTSIGAVVSDDITSFGKIDVALLCVPTRTVPELAKKYLAMGIHTVDSFDIHPQITMLRQELGNSAKAGNAVSIISAGWDPGSDSVIRALLQAIAPNGITYTNFGPGMSMGHSVAAKAVEGVKDALSMTIPLGSSIHRRIVYVELEQGADFETVAKVIKADSYFSKDETHVMQVESIKDVADMGHGVEMIRKGVSGTTHNQLFSFNMKINNPAATSQIMVSCARAAMLQSPGAYTLIEIPVIDMLYGEREEIISKLV